MKLILKKLRWMNFLATGNHWTEIDLLSHKTLLLVGKNGSGKSTLLDALSFVLFNKPFRKINKPQLVNSITNANCLVECEFEINRHQFLVKRGIKPAVFEIYCDDKLVNEDPDNRDYQNALEKQILRINHQTFCQIVVLGSAIFVPFLALKTPQRREVVEDIGNLSIFSDMNKLLKLLINEDDKKLQRKLTEREILENKIQLMEEHIKELNETHTDAIVNKEAHIKEWEEKLEALRRAMFNVEETIHVLEDHVETGLTKYRPKQIELTKLKTELRHKIQMTNKDILFLMNNETCPTCKQVLQETFKIEAIKEKKEHILEVEVAIQKLNMSIEAIDEKLTTIAQLETELRETERNRDQVESNIDRYTLEIAETTEEIEQIRLRVLSADFEKFNEVQKELEDIQTVIVEMADSKAVRDYAVVLLKDTGIKSRIIKTFIPVINQLIAKYLANLDFFVEFTLDENFQEHIKSRYRDEFSYESFSQGEKLRLDLAILFTWRAIAKLRSSVNINIIILDEILDGSADSDGIANIIDLIDKMNEDNIIIISHREDQMTDRFSKVLRFEKSKNFSRLTE